MMFFFILFLGVMQLCQCRVASFMLLLWFVGLRQALEVSDILLVLGSSFVD